MNNEPLTPYEIREILIEQSKEDKKQKNQQNEWKNEIIKKFGGQYFIAHDIK
jgi:hypothetical protein